MSDLSRMHYKSNGWLKGDDCFIQPYYSDIVSLYDLATLLVIRRHVHHGHLAHAFH